MTSSTSTSSSSDCLFCYCFTMSLAVIGGFAVLRFLYSIFRIVYSHFIRGGVDLKKYGAGSGAWAVITGGTDGIGKAFAVALAKKGFNIVLVSRTPSKLDEVSKEIKAESQVQVKTVAIDLSKANNDDYDRLSTAIVGLDVSVLVNNAGLSNEIPEKYLETDPQRVRDIVAVNITAVNEVTRVVLPLLVQRRKGLVFNIGSASSIVPTPLLSVYSASKAYLSYWSQALAAEYASSGVHVECQIPFFVVTKMSKRSRSSLTIPTPNTYVRNALGKTGFETNYSPYFIHDLMGWAMRLLPESFLIQKNKQMHEDIQKRAIAKKQREATQSTKKD